MKLTPQGCQAAIHSRPSTSQGPLLGVALTVSGRGRSPGLDGQGLGQGRAGQSGHTGPGLPDLCHRRPQKPSPPPSLPGQAPTDQLCPPEWHQVLKVNMEDAGDRGARGSHPAARGEPRDGAHTGPARGGPEVCRVLLWPKVPSAPTLGRSMGFFLGGGGWHMMEHHPCQAPSLGTVFGVLTQGHTAKQHIRTRTPSPGPRGSVLPRKNWGTGAEE